MLAVQQGWAGDKVRAWRDVIKWLPELLRERRVIQATRRVSALEFSRSFTADISTPLLGRAGRSRVLRLLLRGYWAVVKRILR
jgi:hypothetical protein